MRFFQLIVDTEFLKMLFDHLFTPRGRHRAEQADLLNAVRTTILKEDAHFAALNDLKKVIL